MAPKRRDKETDSSKNSRADLVQADHELFLQAFEKPTQIYRFLRSRSLMNPIFLNRTLSYMKSRMSRSNKGRKLYQMHSMLEEKMKSQSQNVPQNLPGYMTLTFLGVFDKKGESHEDPAKVETLLLKVCHKKRKDVSCPVQTKSLGTNFIAYNPSEGSPPLKVPALSIPLESFSLTEGNQVKSYHLQLRVGFTNSVPLPNGDLDSEPALKRRKTTLKGDEEGEMGWHQYGHDLIIYDKQNRCQLTDGYYELVLETLTPGAKMSQGLSSWEYIGTYKEDDSDQIGPFESFNNGPTIKFHLRWSREAVGKLVDRPKPVTQIVDDILDNNSNKENDRPEKEEPNEKKLQIVYQFLYNNNSRQQTEACEDLHCPWCSLDCTCLYSLLKHLKLCHPRFTFTYVPIPGGARIDVAINENYDGSYSGSPQDLIAQPPGLAFSRNGPVRRTAMSNILVCNPKRPPPSLSEFLELDETEFDAQRPYITGHNRLYHHTTTCLPIYPKEMDVDSEDENDPKWLQTKTMMMIDEFTDVNEGEKELMKAWNLHVMKHGYVGDCQIPLACSMFIQAKGQEILKKNLYRNFVLHMSNLFDFGLVSAVTVYTTIQRLQELVEEGGDESKVLEQSCQAQRVHWAAEGASRALETRRVASPAQPPTNTGPAERRKPSASGQPKTPIQAEALKKRSVYTNQAEGAQQPPAKKKLSVSGKPTPVNDKEKKRPPEKPADKADNVAKKKSANGGLILVPKPSAQPTSGKDKEEPERSTKPRRKSTMEPVKKPEPAEAVVVLRRKSCPPGATADTKKRGLENGVTHGSGVS